MHALSHLLINPQLKSDYGLGVTYPFTDNLDAGVEFPRYEVRKEHRTLTLGPTIPINWKIGANGGVVVLMNGY